MNDDDTTTTEGPPIAAEFAHLEAQAMQIEGDAAPPPTGPPPPTEGDMAGELYEALVMLREMAAPTMAWWPDYRTVWSDTAVHRIADAGAVVMVRHGLTLGEVWTHLGPYIALIAATLPPALATWQAVQERKLRGSMPSPLPEVPKS